VQNGARGKEGRAGGSARRATAKGAPRPGHSTAARSPALGNAHTGEGAGDGAVAPCFAYSSLGGWLLLR